MAKVPENIPFRTEVDGRPASRTARSRLFSGAGPGGRVPCQDALAVTPDAAPVLPHHGRLCTFYQNAVCGVSIVR